MSCLSLQYSIILLILYKYYQINMYLYVFIIEFIQNCREILYYYFVWLGLYCSFEYIIYYKEILGTLWYKVDILEIGKINFIMEKF